MTVAGVPSRCGGCWLRRWKGGGRQIFFSTVCSCHRLCWDFLGTMTWGGGGVWGRGHVKDHQLLWLRRSRVVHVWRGWCVRYRGGAALRRSGRLGVWGWHLLWGRCLCVGGHWAINDAEAGWRICGGRPGRSFRFSWTLELSSLRLGLLRVRLLRTERSLAWQRDWQKRRKLSSWFPFKLGLETE